MTNRPTNQVFWGTTVGLMHKTREECSFGDAPRSERQQHDRDGTDFPFKISSRDLTVCHYCAALLDGSADERAIAVGNRHEKVDQMDTQPLEGRQQREEGAMRCSHTSQKIIHILSHINLVCGFKKKIIIISYFYSSLFKEEVMNTVIFIHFTENYPN